MQANSATWLRPTWIRPTWLRPVLIRVRELPAWLSVAATLRADRRGVTALEYGMIAALIAVAIVTSVTSVGANLKSTFTLLAAKV